jgi:alkylation response protein AidB-like acyl-CoA dehydrogenase
MGEMGLIGLPYSTEYEGAGGDYLSYILAVEEISKVDGSLGNLTQFKLLFVWEH